MRGLNAIREDHLLKGAKGGAASKNADVVEDHQFKEFRGFEKREGGSLGVDEFLKIKPLKKESKAKKSRNHRNHWMPAWRRALRDRMEPEQGPRANHLRQAIASRL